MNGKTKRQETMMKNQQSSWHMIAVFGVLCLLMTGCTEADRQTVGEHAAQVGRDVLRLAEQEIARRAGTAMPADGPGPRISDAEVEMAIVRLTNDERAREGLQALALDATLGAMARARSADMAARGYYGHFDPQTGARLHPADSGENLNRVRPLVFDERVPVDIVADWMRSAGHRRTLLHNAYTRTGVGVAETRSGIVYVTQLFQ